MENQKLFFFIHVVILATLPGSESESANVTQEKDLSSNDDTGNATKEIQGKAKELIHATLPFVLRSAGFIECQGANSETAGAFFGEILGHGINYTGSDYLCGPTCQGTCIPRPSDVGVPKNNLPYGCLCSTDGCDLSGPKVAPMAQPYFKMACRQDARCTCFGMGPGQFDGYSCQWFNVLSGLPITFTEKLVAPPAKGIHRFSPIKWCSCCPRHSLGKHPH